MILNEERKQLNRELKKVVRGGHSPSQALEYSYLMWGALLGECADDDEIMKWTAKMIRACVLWQSEAVTTEEFTALLKTAEQIEQYYSGFGADMERNKTMNEVTLVGAIDGEIKAFQGERSTKTSFRLVTITARARNGKEFINRHNIVLWGDKAQAAADHLTAGDVVMVKGRIGTRKYTKKDGTDAYITEITADGIYKEVVGTNTNRDEVKADGLK